MMLIFGPRVSSFQWTLSINSAQGVASVFLSPILFFFFFFFNIFPKTDRNFRYKSLEWPAWFEGGGALSVGKLQLGISTCL